MKNTIYTIEGEKLSSVATEIKVDIKPRTTYYYRITVVADNGDWAVSDIVLFETGGMKKSGEHSDLLSYNLDQTGVIQTSNPRLDRLFANCLSNLKGNLLDMPSEYPQRNGRLGYTGDIATFIPLLLYEYYGDTALLREQYPIMKGWVDDITKKDVERGQKYLLDFRVQLGDEVTNQIYKGGTEAEFIVTAYYYESSKKLAKAAGILGITEDAVVYSKLASNIKKVFIAEYFTKMGRLAIDTQTAYYICLKFQLYPDKKRLITGLNRRLKKDGYIIKSGFVGTTMMCTVLSEIGMADIAYDFLSKETVSGIEMNSLNHYAFGSVIEFLYRGIAGIHALAPGFSKIRIAPQVNNRLQYCYCTYESSSGRIVTNWKIEKNGSMSIHIEIPFNVTAEVTLPFHSKDSFEISSGSYDYQYKPEKDLLLRYSLQSRLEELTENEEAMKILREYAYGLYEMIQAERWEILSMQLSEVVYAEYLGLDSKKLQKAIDKILKIKIKFE